MYSCCCVSKIQLRTEISRKTYTLPLCFFTILPWLPMMQLRAWTRLFYKALSSALPSWLSRSLFASRILEGRYTCLTWGLSFWVTALCFSTVLPKTSPTQMTYLIKTVPKKSLKLQLFASLFSDQVDECFSTKFVPPAETFSFTLLCRFPWIFLPHYYTTIVCIFFFIIA